jgi:hypothetical protein
MVKPCPSTCTKFETTYHISEKILARGLQLEGFGANFVNIHNVPGHFCFTCGPILQKMDTGPNIEVSPRYISVPVTVVAKIIENISSESKRTLTVKIGCK